MKIWFALQCSRCIELVWCLICITFRARLIVQGMLGKVITFLCLADYLFHGKGILIPLMWENKWKMVGKWILLNRWYFDSLPKESYNKLKKEKKKRKEKNNMEKIIMHLLFVFKSFFSCLIFLIHLQSNNILIRI